MMSKINPLMNKCMLFWKDVFWKIVFSVCLKSSSNMIPKHRHIIAGHILSTFILTRIVQNVVLILKSAQHCLYSSGKDRCTQHMWSNDMSVLWNYKVSSNVMWTIRNEADKTFFRTT